MTEFQREIGVLVVLLTFLLGYFCCVVIVRTGIAGELVAGIK